MIARQGLTVWRIISARLALRFIVLTRGDVRLSEEPFATSLVRVEPNKILWTGPQNAVAIPAVTMGKGAPSPMKMGTGAAVGYGKLYL